MNIFVAVMVFFAALGLFDRMLGGKLGLMPEFDRGLENMGGLAVSTVGFYSIGVSFVQNHADAIAGVSGRLLFDPSLIIGSLLAPDMGALAIAQKMAASPEIAVFTGAMVAGSLGMTVGYQLPVFLAAVKKDEIPELMRGFIFGIIAIPSGLIAGGLMIGLPPAVIFANMIPVLVICLTLIVAFVLASRPTMKALIAFGNLIRILSFVLFGISMIGLFLPEYAVVEDYLVKEMLYMVMRMIVVCCGGLVMSHLALMHLEKPIRKAGECLGINNESVVGLVLSLTQSLAMLPLFSRMDRRGKILNAAFSVAGAYVVGGQLAFVSSLVTSGQTTAYMVCKILAGAAGVLLALAADKRITKKDRA